MIQARALAGGRWPNCPPASVIRIHAPMPSVAMFSEVPTSIENATVFEVPSVTPAPRAKS